MLWQATIEKRVLPDGRSRASVVGRTMRAALGTAARRNSAGRVAASLKTGARRTPSAGCSMARGDATSGHRATSRATPPREAGGGGDRRWATADGRATRRCWRRLEKTVRESGERCKQLLTPRRGATVRGASPQALRLSETRAERAVWHGTARQRA